MNTIVIYGAALAAAAAVLFGAYRCFASRTPDGFASGSSLRVVTRTRVGVGRSLVLVEVEGRRLLLGSTREQWSALADLGAARQGMEPDALDGIEEELLRASEATRSRRWPR
jgi:flagellar biogenesis protein FliO